MGRRIWRESEIIKRLEENILCQYNNIKIKPYMGGVVCDAIFIYVCVSDGGVSEGSGGGREAVVAEGDWMREEGKHCSREGGREERREREEGGRDRGRDRGGREGGREGENTVIHISPLLSEIANPIPQ